MKLGKKKSFKGFKNRTCGIKLETLGILPLMTLYWKMKLGELERGWIQNCTLKKDSERFPLTPRRWYFWKCVGVCVCMHRCVSVCVCVCTCTVLKMGDGNRGGRTGKVSNKDLILLQSGWLPLWYWARQGNPCLYFPSVVASITSPNPSVMLLYASHLFSKFLYVLFHFEEQKLLYRELVLTSMGWCLWNTVWLTHTKTMAMLSEYSL